MGKLLKVIIGLGVLLIAAMVCASLGSPSKPVMQPVIVSTAVSTQAQAAAASTKPVPTSVPADIEPTAMAPAIGKVGDTIAQGDYRLTVTKVENATAFGDFTKAAKGKKLVAVELLIESAADKGVDINPAFYAKIKDTDGYEYSAEIVGKEPGLKAQNNLPKGEKVRGWVTFEVLEAATGLVLTYQPMTLGSDVRLRVDLGQ